MAKPQWKRCKNAMECNSNFIIKSLIWSQLTYCLKLLQNQRFTMYWRQTCILNFLQQSMVDSRQLHLHISATIGWMTNTRNFPDWLSVYINFCHRFLVWISSEHCSRDPMSVETWWAHCHSPTLKLLHTLSPRHTLMLALAFSRMSLRIFG